MLWNRQTKKDICSVFGIKAEAKVLSDLRLNFSLGYLNIFGFSEELLQ